GLSPFLQLEGMYVEVQGRVWAKRWAGVAPTAFVSVLGRGQMPEPIRRSWDHLMTGRDEGRWVQVDGIVTAFEKQRLTLNVSGGQIIAWVNEIDPGVQNRLLGSIVRVSGVCRAVRNGRGQQLGVRLLIPSAEQVEILKASPGNPFDVPMLPVGSIMRVQARNIGFTIQLVKTAGVVTHKNMRQLFVQDGADALRVVTREDSSVQPGDQVEVVGLAEADGLSPKLVQAWVRKTGQSALPAMHPIDLHHMDSSVAGITQDSTLGSIEATYLGRSANEFLQILELQDGKEKNPFYAYLPLAQEAPFELPIGSRVRLRGVFKAKIDTVPDFGQVVTAFEMYLNSPADITLLQRPPWWTTRHTLWSGSALGSILLGALAWAGLLRKQVRRRTRELDAKIIEQQQTEWELQAQIAEGKQMEIEIEKTHQELLDASRQAGMAEIATNVLHNVGNVLNSVNISCSVIESTVRKSNIGSVAKVSELLVKNSDNLPDFFSGDPIGRKLPDFFGKLAARLEKERTAVLGEVDSLGRNIEHIKAIVAFQQNYAKGFRVGESLPLADVVEHALKINAEALTRARIEVVRDFQPVPPVTMERHKVLQILVNLIRNANHALTDADQAGSRKLSVRVVGENDRVFVTVRDNGIGIPLENLTRIFAHGFTTRKEGHGFGLHSGVLAASEMGGRLTVESGGLGKGAAFTLELPIHFEAALPRPSEG
ncbi:MAG: sensor signal transduction histidine kinase, partial [Chthoniobacteraceae bacterium]|nr:sensor signal transduction histidine kinase [Chthoniobacteraceae bacterium]